MTISLWLIISGLVLFHFLTRYSRRGRIANKLPGMTAYPVFGNLLHFRDMRSDVLWNKLREITTKYYPITRIWYFFSPIISIRHPDDVEILLSSQKAIDKGYVYNYLHPWLKTGLLTSTGEKWRHRRKILTNAFHFEVLKKYVNVINDESKKVLENLQQEGKETVKSLLPFTSDLTLNVICEAAMGVSLDKMDNELIKKYKKAIHDFGNVIIRRIPRPYLRDWMMKPTWKWGRTHTDSLKVLSEFTETVVKERRAFHKSTNNQFLKELKDSSTIHTKSKKKLSMLDLLLAAEQDNVIDAEGVKEEVDTFTFEGHDTTGMALTYTLMLLAENEEAQDKVRSEATEIFNRAGGKIEQSDLSDFNYLELCIKESLRLYPPVATIFRYTAEDLQLKNGLVPGGLHIMFNIYDLHRDPNYWPEPHKFDPDRFLPENTRNRHPFSYVPFSAGPRNCIGQKFAMYELKLMIAHILHNYYLKSIDRSDKVQIMADIVIRPRDPISIKFVKINE